MIKINPDILVFYKDLEKNNNREWFEKQKSRYKALESELKVFNEEVKNGLDKEDDIERVKMFRIYRVVRFSKDKTPYKTHVGVSFHRKKPKLRGGYYMHIKPENSFIAGGFWDPNPKDLFRIRKELEFDAQELRNIINEKKFNLIWGELQGEKVKTAPKNFNKEHPDIDLIRHKQYIFIKKFNDKSVLSSDFLNEVINNFIAIRPFFDHMTNILTTDLNGIPII